MGSDTKQSGARAADGQLYPAAAVASGDAGAVQPPQQQQVLLPAAQRKMYRDETGGLQLRTTAPAASHKVTAAAPAPSPTMAASHGPAPEAPKVDTAAVSGREALLKASRIAESGREDDRLAFGRDKAAEDTLNTMRSGAQAFAARLSEPLNGKALFDQQFVGRANMNNPSFRNAMLMRGSYAEQAKGQAQELAQMNTNIAGFAGQAPVGGRAYNSAVAASKAGVEKTLADANAAQATAAAGGKGTHTKDTTVSDIAELAKSDPRGVKVATNNLASLKKGGTGTSYTVDENGKPRTYSGILTAEQKAALDKDEAELTVSKAKATKWHSRVTNWATGAGRDYEAKNTAFRKKLSDVARPDSDAK